LRLRLAEIVSQIIASDNAIGGLNPSRPILYFGYPIIGAQLDAQCCFGRIELLDAARRSEQRCARTPELRAVNIMLVS
jgi:hypothetical protein